MMRSVIGKAALLLPSLLLVPCATAAAADSCPAPVTASGTFHELQVPGATNTDPLAINSAGDIVGAYGDAQGRAHGFLYRNGMFHTIDVPGSSSSFAADINASGTIVGNFGSRAYVLRDGSFTFIDAPGAFATSATAINDRGAVAGLALEPNDSDGREVGFVRGRDGSFERIAFDEVAGVGVRDITNQGTLLVNADLSQLLRTRGEYETIQPCSASDIIIRLTRQKHFVGATFEPSLQMSFGLVHTHRQYTLYQYPGAVSTLLRDVNSAGLAVGQANDPVRGSIGFVFVPE
jgi:probable HAF family extracellular repeat protein